MFENASTTSSHRATMSPNVRPTTSSTTTSHQAATKQQRKHWYCEPSFDQRLVDTVRTRLRAPRPLVWSNSFKFNSIPLLIHKHHSILSSTAGTASSYVDLSWPESIASLSHSWVFCGGVFGETDDSESLIYSWTPAKHFVIFSITSRPVASLHRTLPMSYPGHLLPTVLALQAQAFPASSNTSNIRRYEHPHSLPLHWRQCLRRLWPPG